MTIKTFNRGNLNAVRSDVMAALAEVGEKHGVAFDLGNIRFEDKAFRVTMNASVTAVPDEKEQFWEAMSQNADEAELIRETAFTNVLPASLRGRQFEIGGRIFTLVGVKKSRYKYPFSGVGQQGGRYKFTVDQVVNGLIA